MIDHTTIVCLREWGGVRGPCFHPTGMEPNTPSFLQRRHQGVLKLTVKTPVETFLNPYQTNKLDNEIISIKLFTLVSFVED